MNIFQYKFRIQIVILILNISSTIRFADMVPYNKWQRLEEYVVQVFVIGLFFYVRLGANEHTTHLLGGGHSHQQCQRSCQSVAIVETLDVKSHDLLIAQDLSPLKPIFRTAALRWYLHRQKAYHQ